MFFYLLFQLGYIVVVFKIKCNEKVFYSFKQIKKETTMHHIKLIRRTKTVNEFNFIHVLIALMVGI